MANVSIVLAPAVVLANRVKGSYGIGEVVQLSCTVSPPVPGLAGIPGGVVYKVTKGSGTIAAAAPLAGTATFTAALKAEDVTISAYAGNDRSKVLATAGLKIVAPSVVKFVQTGNVRHTHGQADEGVYGHVYV